MTEIEPVTMFRCVHCRTVYPAEEQALACAARGWHQFHQPGDIVVDVRACGLWIDDYTKTGVFDNPASRMGREFCAVPGIYGSDDPWIFLHGAGLHGRPAIAPYWVVGAVTSVAESSPAARDSAHEKHRVAYHLFTEAGACEPGTPAIQGWTTMCGHTPVMPPPGPLPERLKELAAKYVGRKARHLLYTH
jgi:hypothetical protein